MLHVLFDWRLREVEMVCAPLQQPGRSGMGAASPPSSATAALVNPGLNFAFLPAAPGPAQGDERCAMSVCLGYFLSLSRGTGEFPWHPGEGTAFTLSLSLEFC